MKKLLFSFFVLTVSFLSSANDAMAVLGECVDRDGNLVISALGKTGDATFEDGIQLVHSENRTKPSFG